MHVVRWLMGLALALSQAALASTVSGRLDDPGNAALRGADLGAAQFTDAAAMANNIALHSFTLAHDGAVRFESLGFAQGGIDPYFSLFFGSGLGSGASFVASNYLQAFSTGGDFQITLNLTAGDYLISIGAFANMSYAENLGAGSLDLGFVGLGSETYLGNGYYEIEVQTGSQPLPEPGTWLLLAASGAALFLSRRSAARWRRAVRQVPEVMA